MSKPVDDRPLCWGRGCIAYCGYAHYSGHGKGFAAVGPSEVIKNLQEALYLGQCSRFLSDNGKIAKLVFNPVMNTTVTDKITELGLSKIVLTSYFGE